MFRRIEATLPADASYPADLEKLGFFVNNKGQVRRIDNPDCEYVYYYTTNPRHNDVLREAVQVCQRDEVLLRLAKLGIQQLYLPQLTYTKPDPQEPSVPILAPSADALRNRKHVFLLVNDDIQDLGILAYRQLQREMGLNGGSVVDFAKEIINRSDRQASEMDIQDDLAEVKNKVQSAPGLIVTNIGQRFYSYKAGRPVTIRSWDALPRPSILHESAEIHELNYVKGSHGPHDHIKFVLDNVVMNELFVSPDAEIYIIGIEGGGYSLLEVLDEGWEKYGHRISALALMQSGFDPQTFRNNPQLRAFLRERTREWKVAETKDANVCIEVPKYENDPKIERIPDGSNMDADPSSLDEHDWLEPVPSSAGIDHDAGSPAKTTVSNVTEYPVDGPFCPTFSGGDVIAAECIFTNPAVYGAVLNFFHEVYIGGGKCYRNPEFQVEIEDEDGSNELRDPTPEEIEVQELGLNIADKRRELDHMTASLDSTPADNPKYQEGINGLKKRIDKGWEEYNQMVKHRDDLIKQYKAEGKLPEEVVENGAKWEHQGGSGQMVKLGGGMIELDLLRDAGLLDDIEDGIGELAV